MTLFLVAAFGPWSGGSLCLDGCASSSFVMFLLSADVDVVFLLLSWLFLLLFAWCHFV
jgi:hypothetical protein